MCKAFGLNASLNKLCGYENMAKDRDNGKN
jgi:hypothetical protein